MGSRYWWSPCVCVCTGNIWTHFQPHLKKNLKKEHFTKTDRGHYTKAWTQSHLSFLVWNQNSIIKLMVVKTPNSLKKHLWSDGSLPAGQGAYTFCCIMLWQKLHSRPLSPPPHGQDPALVPISTPHTRWEILHLHEMPHTDFVSQQFDSGAQD